MDSVQCYPPPPNAFWYLNGFASISLTINLDENKLEFRGKSEHSHACYCSRFFVSLIHLFLVAKKLCEVFPFPGLEKIKSWVEWGFYALSASKAIFRARTYNCNLFSPVIMITWWMKLGGNRPPGDNPLLFSISGTGSFICQKDKETALIYGIHTVPSGGANLWLQQPCVFL